MVIEEQGDHSFTTYHQHLAAIHQFLVSAPSS